MTTKRKPRKKSIASKWMGVKAAKPGTRYGSQPHQILPTRKQLSR